MNLFDLRGKTALITGASSGLGKQFAQCLSTAGARVILVSRRKGNLESLAAALPNARVYAVDVGDQAAVQQMMDHLEGEGEKIHICINNAGIAKYTPLFASSPHQDFEEIIKINLLGVWYVTHAITHHMKRHAIKGSIINIGSVNGNAIPAHAGAAYSVSKAAVIHLTKTLVGELSPYHIRINCISPGWFTTPMTEGSPLDKITAHIPYGSVAQPSDLDGLVLYLASNTASQYVTGACFTIDGGMSWGGLPWE